MVTREPDVFYYARTSDILYNWTFFILSFIIAKEKNIYLLLMLKQYYKIRYMKNLFNNSCYLICNRIFKKSSREEKKQKKSNMIF